MIKSWKKLRKTKLEKNAEIPLKINTARKV